MSVVRALARPSSAPAALRGRVPALAVAGVIVPALAAFSLVATASQIPLLLLSTVALALCVTAGRDRIARGWVHAAEARRIARRERARFAALGRNEPRRMEYRELREMVDRIVELDPVLAAELELEDLLDRFVAVAVAHATRAELALRPLPTYCTLGEGLAVKVGRRRIAYRADCRRIADRLEDELAAIRELVVLTLERACTSDEIDTPLESEVARRLWILAPAGDAEHVDDADASG